MRVGNLHAESNFLAANIAFCHLSAPPSKGLFYKATNISYQICGANASFFSSRRQEQGSAGRQRVSFACNFSGRVL
jgi:hypothetical protein